MPKTRPEPRYTAAKGPVNLRKAGPAARRPEPPDARLRARMSRLRARGRLGPPISRSLAPRRRSGLPGPALVVLILSSLVTVFAVALGSAAGLALAGLAAMAASGWRLLRARRPGLAHASALEALPGLDAAALRAFDEALDALAAELPEPLVPELLRLKATLIGLAQPPAGAALGPEDRAYLVECLRRYIPDTIGAYLAIPAAQRGQPVQQTGRDAHALLQEQLAAIQAELDRRHARLVADAGERLLLQHRFLRAKSDRH